MPAVKKFNSLFLSLTALLSGTALADVGGFKCSAVVSARDGQEYSVTLLGSAGGDLSRKAVSVQDFSKPAKETKGTWKSEPDSRAAGTFRISAGGAPLGSLVIVDAAKGIGTLSYEGGSYACQVFPAADANHAKDYRDAVQAWNKFKARQPRACSPAADSRENIREERPNTTVVLLQGYAISPVHMRSIQDAFAQLGMNVLVPRLRGHFNVNPRDLDDVKAEQWVRQSEEVLKIAGKMSPRVIVAGYSLGGLLASRLALLHPEKISAVMLFSPAWRVTGMIKAGSAIGSVFGLSANDLFGSGVHACGVYISAKGGREVERVISLTEEAAGGSEYSASSSAFRRFKMPSLVANILDDDTVDGAFVNEVRGGRNSFRTATVTFTQGNHVSWMYRIEAMKPDYAPFKGNMAVQIERFLRANGLTH